MYSNILVEFKYIRNRDYYIMRVQKTIKSNFIYNMLLKGLNIVFPLLTFPFIARILSPEGIGKVDFSLSFIQYFILISQMGIPIYAIRECAKFRDDKIKLTKTVQELLMINIIMNIISYLLFAFIIFNISKLIPYRELLIIASFNILGTSMGIEWFYQAIEEYRYIAIRSMLVKLFSMILIFIFIRDEYDYVIYGLITVLSTLIGYIWNFVYINKHIKLFKRYNNYKVERHIKPILMLFAMSISISIYVNLDNVMLGFMSGNTSVGLYTAGNKVIKVIIALVTSLGAVLLPRMSYYIEKNEKFEIKRLINKSLDFILMISIPCTVGVFMLAEPIILTFAGEGYIKAVSTVRIISPIIIAVALSNLIGIQILVSHGKEKSTMISTFVGATINFSLNLILIPKFQQNGAAVGTLIAETAVTIIQIILAYSYIKGNINYKNIIKYLIGGLIIAIVCICGYLINGSEVITIFLSVLISIAAYFSFLYINKSEFIYNTVNKFMIKIKK